jgi:hypothetical protein
MSTNATSLTRRIALFGAVGVGALAVKPNAAKADSAVPDTPILQLFHKRCDLRDWIISNAAHLSTDQLDFLSDELSVLDASIMRLSSTCAADFAAKVITFTAEGGLTSSWEHGEIWVEARALTGTGV